MPVPVYGPFETVTVRARVRSTRSSSSIRIRDGRYRRATQIVRGIDRRSPSSRRDASLNTAAFRPTDAVS